MVSKRRELKGKMNREGEVFQIRLESRAVEVSGEVPHALCREGKVLVQEAAFKWESTGQPIDPLTLVSLLMANSWH